MRRVLTLGVVLVLCLLFQVRLSAQNINATVSGRILDAGGAAVAGAKITATNVDTLTTATFESTAEGTYVLSDVRPGNYRIEVAKEGFKTAVRTGVVLHTQDAVTMNIDLAVGSVDQNVTVTGEVPLVNTTNSSIGNLVDQEKIVELPLNGRSYTDLVFLQPGIAKSTTQSSVSAPGGTIYSSNGAPTRSNNYLLDGAPLQTLQGYSATSVGNTQLGVDGIQEYKTVTSNFSADYGMTMGSQMTLISKGGTNQFHGDVFEFLRNGALDARNFFDYTYVQTGKRVPQYQRNNFGGAFGGPIKQNKLFFYGVFERLKERKGLPFIQNVLAAGCHAPAGTVLTSATCSNITSGSATVAAVMLPFIALYTTTPNLSATQNSFTFIQPTDVYYGQMRGDYTISSSDSFFMRYNTEKATLNTGSAAGPGTMNLLSSWNQYATISETHVFSTNLLNSTRFSYSRTNQAADFTSPSGQNISFADLSGTGVAGTRGMSNVSAPGLSGLGATGLAPSQYFQNLYSLGDDILYTHGKHALKFGVLFNRVEPTFSEVWFSRGTATFGTVNAFLQGNIQNITIQDTNSSVYRRYKWYTFGQYIQDDWRVTSRLTLNLGLRYEVNTDVHEVNGRQYSLRNPYTDVTPTKGPEIQNPSLHNFSPRVGFAWDVTGKGTTSIRGGGGLYYDVNNVASGLTQQATAMPPLSAIYILTNVQAATPLSLAGAINNPVEMFYYSKQPQMLQWNLSVDQKLPFGLVANVSYVGTRGYQLYVQTDGNPVKPVGVDSRGLPLYGCFTAAGVLATPANTGAANVTGVTLNPNGTIATPSAAGGGFTGVGNCPVSNGSAGALPINTSFSNAGPRQNPAWGSNTLAGTFSRSWYDGLQVVVNRRLAKGLQFQSAYAWGKNLDYGQGQIQQDHTGYTTNPYNPAFDKGPAMTNLAKSWRFNLLYHLPNMGSSSGLVSGIVNGWWVGTIYSWQTGFPLSITSTGSRSLSNVEGVNQDRVNLGPTYNHDTVILGTPTKWYDTSMFALQPQGQLGNSGRGIFNGPGLYNWDISLNKDTKAAFLGEKGMVQFRAEFFNILNHANFSLPNQVVFAANGTVSGTAGQITSTQGTPRDIQFGLKLVF